MKGVLKRAKPETLEITKDKVVYVLASTKIVFLGDRHAVKNYQQKTAIGIKFLTNLYRNNNCKIPANETPKDK